MNRQQLLTTLSSATTSTFEELGLLVSSAALDAVQRAAPLDAGVRLDFTGPWPGSVVVRMSEPVLATAAANMLGSEAPPEAALRRDALGELANVICGNLLPAVAGRRAVFHLGAPRWIGTAAAGAELGEPLATVRLGIDDGRAEVALHLPSARVSGAHRSP